MRITMLLFSSVLAAPLAAQGGGTTAAPAATGPLLTLATDHLGIVRGLTRVFGPIDLPAELAAGSHYVVTLTGEAQPVGAVQSGSVGLLQIHANPAGLLRRFASDIDGMKTMFRGVASIGLTQQGMSAKDVARLVDDILAFPAQIEDVSLVATGDPDHLGDGVDVAQRATARADTSFAQFVQHLEPGSQGVPELPLVPGMLAMRLSLEPTDLAALLAPLLDWTLALSFPAGDARVAAGKVIGQMTQLYDGGCSVSIGAAGGMNMLVGLTDAAAAGALFTSDDYLAVLRSQRSPRRDLEIEVTPNALEYRGVHFVATHISSDGPPNPMLPNGESTAYSGSVGQFFILGGSEVATRQIADAAADRKIQRVPLADGAVMAIDVRIDAMLESMRALLPKLPHGDDVPAHFGLRLGRSGRTLLIGVHVR